MGIQGTPNMGMVIFAAIIISLALVFYTIGVFAERRSGTLRPKHLAFFSDWLQVFDTAGTTIMSIVARRNRWCRFAPPCNHGRTRAFAHALPCGLGNCCCSSRQRAFPGPTSIV